MKRKGRKKAKRKKVGEEVRGSAARRKEKKGNKGKEERRRKEKGKKEERKERGEPEPTSLKEHNWTAKDPEMRYER